MMTEKNYIIYLHGFNSSPQSFKARIMSDAMKDLGLGNHVDIPDLPGEPDKAIDLIYRRVDKSRRNYKISFVGSSLGGFYATHLAEKFGGRAVLINPAVQPHVLLAKYLGENVNYHTDEKWVLEQKHIDVFKQLDCEVTKPERYLVLLQTGDETLDYRQAENKYRGCNMIIEQGGDHAFQGFKNHVQEILKFCQFSLDY